MITEEVLRLFLKYCDLLNQEFRNEAAVEWVASQCVRIARRLERRKYGILSENLMRTEKFAGQEGKEIVVMIIHCNLCLIALPPQNQTPIGIAQATSLIYREDPPEGDSVEEMLRRTEMHEQYEIEASASIWHMDWKFNDEDTHAFLAALDRHWPALAEDSRRKGLITEDRETVLTMIKSARTLAPLPRDIYVFSFLLDRELERLLEIDPDAELECGCAVRKHSQLLEDWELRSLL